MPTRAIIIVAVVAVAVLAACGLGTADDSSSPAGSSRPTPANASPEPSGGGYGVPPGMRLKPSGSITARPGQVIEGLDITGRVYVGDGVRGVVIRNCRFTGDGTQWWAVQTEGTGEVTLDHVTIRGDYKDAGIAYHNVTVRHADIYGMTGDGAKVGNNVTITDSWIHDFAPTPESHSDGLQIMERVANVVIKNNVINPGSRHRGARGEQTQVNAALMLTESIDRGTAGRILVQGNILGGGGWTVYFDLPGDTHFIDNVFLRGSYVWGPVDDRGVVREWARNRFADNGEVIPHPRGARATG